MQRARVFGCLFVLAVAAGCADGAWSEKEEIGEAVAAVIDSRATDAVFYRNPGGDEGLPEVVPVVVSKKDGKPDVAVRLDCGGNFRSLLNGFGYFENETTTTFPKYESLSLMRGLLDRKRGDGTEVPMITLRCGDSPADARSQIAQVYRVLDADAVAPDGGTPLEPVAKYYLRLKQDPETIYTVGCANILSSLAWTNATASDLDAVTVPVNRAVFQAWRERGLKERELNCYNNTGRELPPVSPRLVQHPATPAPAETMLYTLSPNPFPDQIFSDDVLYLISGGKGYAVDCGSNHGELKKSLGFTADMVPAVLDPADPAYVSSAPGMQPILRCDHHDVVAYETLNEPAKTRYLQFDGGDTLVRFACPATDAFFGATARATRKVPKEALSELALDTSDIERVSRFEVVGCKPAPIPDPPVEPKPDPPIPVPVADPPAPPYPPPASTHPSTYHSSYHQVFENKAQVGVVAVNWKWQRNTLKAHVCLYDDVTNGKGIYANLSANYKVGTADKWVTKANLFSGTGKWENDRYTLCSEISIAQPAGAGTLNFVHVNFGNYYGANNLPMAFDKVTNVALGAPFKDTKTHIATQLREIKGAACLGAPSSRNCPTVIGQIPKGAAIRVHCQQWGSEVVGPPKNPYWVEVTWSGKRGFMSSYPIDLPDNYVEGVGTCR